MGHTMSQRSSGKHPRTSVALTVAGVNLDTTFAFDGEVLTRYILEAQAMTGATAPSRRLDILDANGVTIYSGPTFTDGTNNVVPVDIELDGQYVVRDHLGGAPGATGADWITLFVR